MSFSTPTFNLLCNIWHGRNPSTALPPVGLPDLSVSCQLRMLKTAFHAVSPSPATLASVLRLMMLCLPPGTDVRPYVGIGHTTPVLSCDIIEVPAASGRYYFTLQVDDVAKGFANEYRCAVLYPLNSPIPIP